MNNQTLHQLLENHASAKAKMILGIVFTAIAFFMSYIGLIALAEDDAFAFLILFSLPAWGIGVPFLITGIINTARTNRQISIAQSEHNKAFMQTPAAPIQPQVYEQPQVAPVQQQVYTQPAPAQPQTFVQPVEQPAQPQQSVSVVSDEAPMQQDNAEG